MSEQEELAEKQLKSEEKFKGVLLHVFSDNVELPDGKQAVREYIRHFGAVCMVPVTEDGKVILERQFRYPLGRVFTEIPAGKLDSPDEDRLAAAKRELLEETGITADNWQCIGDYVGTPAYADEVVTMFLATGLHRGERHLDDEEFINVFEVPVGTVVEDILNGRIIDGKTQAAVLKSYALLKKEGKL